MVSKFLTQGAARRQAVWANVGLSLCQREGLPWFVPSPLWVHGLTAYGCKAAVPASSVIWRLRVSGQKYGRKQFPAVREAKASLSPTPPPPTALPLYLFPVLCVAQKLQTPFYAYVP